MTVELKSANRATLETFLFKVQVDTPLLGTLRSMHDPL